ncbi:hypothetical protein [Pelagovum pacificum]|nr:hypothetical protein [Pelagovum pacificum]
MITMIIRMFVRKGMNEGIRRMSTRGGNDRPRDPEAQRQAAQGRDNSKRARQVMRMARRFGKF